MTFVLGLRDDNYFGGIHTTTRVRNLAISKILFIIIPKAWPEMNRLVSPMLRIKRLVCVFQKICIPYMGGLPSLYSVFKGQVLLNATLVGAMVHI